MIVINNLEKTYGVKPLFVIENLVINPRDKIALIGENGSGKTTFMNILSGLDQDYKGNIEAQNNIELVDWNNQEKISNKAYSMEGLKPEENKSPGQKYRLVLSSYLEHQRTYLLIDEPTSHLDFEAKDFLIEKLQTRNYGFLLISHDRDFINKTCNKIIEIVDGKFYVYNGSYQFYLEEKANMEKFHKKEYENYVTELDRLNAVMTGLKERGSKIKTTPKRFGNSEARLHKMGGQENKRKVDNQIKSVKSRIDHLEVKEKPQEKTIIKLEIPEENKIYAKRLVEGKNIVKSFDNNIIFDKADFYINNNRKVALLGENGSGKTTLINMIINSENIKLHSNLKIGYFSQLSDILDLEENILENIIPTSIYEESMIRIILARLGIKKEDVYKTVKVLSDGEKAKVKLTKLLTSGFNFLIFDEPTNFLDIYTIEALEELLLGYDGAILFVSHDRVFVNKIADQLLIIENKKIKKFVGKLDEYENPKDEVPMDEFLLDFKIASISSRLSMEISKEEKEHLFKEYKKLQQLKNNK